MAGNAGNRGGDGNISAEAFMTEFNQNAQIFGQLIVPWANLLITMLPQISQAHSDLGNLEADIGLIWGRLIYWESKVGDDALADALTADQLTGEACTPPPLNLDGGVG